MKISSNVEIIGRKDGSILTIINGVEKNEIDPTRLADCMDIYNKARKMDEDKREAWLNGEIASGKYTSIFGKGATSSTETTKVEDTPLESLQSALAGLIDFFKEFEFEPNYRFVNTLALALSKSKQSAMDYISAYFELIDSPYRNEIKAKITCAEFAHILEDMSKVEVKKTVNNRFKIYYGSQGTGKTTLAQKESSGRCVVCNASMLPSDLMEDFVFNEAGKPAFNASALRDAMENGKILVLDEINLLPFDSLRFLQGILDGKSEFNYKGETVHINDGFMIIGTMNLSVNGMVYGLPEPLVDRCAEMRKFMLTAENLVSAIIDSTDE